MRKKTEGYVVIIVLLLVSVLLMLGLSLASRTTEEVYLSGQESDTTRVFNQAESGIEEGLALIQAGTKTVDSATVTNVVDANVNEDTKVNYKVTGRTVADFNLHVDQGDALTLKWKTGTTIKWEHNATCNDNPAAIIVSVYYKDGSAAKEAHLAYRPYGANADCDKGSNFTSANQWTGTNPGPGSYVNLTNNSFGNPPGLDVDLNALLRIRPLYNDARFYLTGSSVIELTSSATDNTNAGAASQANRKIQAIRTEPAPPAIFDYAVFGGGALQKL